MVNKTREYSYGPSKNIWTTYNTEKKYNKSRNKEKHASQIMSKIDQQMIPSRQREQTDEIQILQHKTVDTELSTQKPVYPSTQSSQPNHQTTPPQMENYTKTNSNDPIYQARPMVRLPPWSYHTLPYNHYVSKPNHTTLTHNIMQPNQLNNYMYIPTTQAYQTSLQTYNNEQKFSNHIDLQSHIQQPQQHGFPKIITPNQQTFRLEATHPF